MRNLGVDLPYSFMTDAKPADPRFVETAEEVAYWDQVGARCGRPAGCDQLGRR